MGGEYVLHRIGRTEVLHQLGASARLRFAFRKAYELVWAVVSVTRTTNRRPSGDQAVPHQAQPLAYGVVGNPGPPPPAPSRTIVYVDGFNLYYGALKDTPYKWLNLDTLCRLLLAQHHTIDRIKYFTAQVSARPDDPDQATRQQIYFRALRTIPHLDIILGHFLTSHVRMRLVNPPAQGPRTAQVIKTEEKGSDVNLATMLLVDGFQDRYDVAAVISNDSDLALPIRMVRQILHKPVVVFNPHAMNPKSKPSKTLRQVASQYRPIRAGALASSQFAPNLVDANGGFNKPATW